MSINTGFFKVEIKSLSPELLLKIFLYLESHETVILRSVCKEFLEVIDNNKSLWRILDWEQQEKESSVLALEKFDEKSASTIKEVSIFQGKGEIDTERLIKILHRSKKSLTNLSLTIERSWEVSLKVKALASGAPLLSSLILWPSDQYWMSRFPKTRLNRSSSHPPPLIQHRPLGKVQILWRYGLAQDWEEKLDVSSLISFTDPSLRDPLQLFSVISKFSQSIIHFSISISPQDRQPDAPTSLSCPNLSVLEGEFPLGFPPWIEAPNLRIFIAKSINPVFFQQLPVSVQELWLLGWHHILYTERNLDFLPQLCPQLKVLKLGKDFLEEGFETEDILNSFRAREEKVQGGVEIEGIKMESLKKLVVPTELFEPEQLNRLSRLVGEVIDIKDYPDFIGLEY